MIGPLTLQGEEATARLAADIAMVAEPGWTIRLEGDLGAGKTSFARAFIRALARDPALEVPSPTYTLVQRYDEAEPAVLHADLYRLSDPQEVEELGLADPDDPAIRLIEWPDRAGAGAFADPLTLCLAMHGAAARTASVEGPEHKLARIDRTLAVRAFLERADKADAVRTRLQGDASSRRYERLPEAGLILMDAPRQPDGPPVRDGKPYSQLVHLAESVHAFAAVGLALQERGFAAPALAAHDLDAGLVLLEDLGTEGVLTPDGTPDAERYIAAAQLLAEVHAEDWTADLPVPGGGTHHLHRYDGDVFLTEIALCPQWYLPHRQLARDAFDQAGFEACWRDLLAPLNDAALTLTLRDYHSPNLLWRDQAEVGSARQRLGLIDFQDALFGPPAYDVASLIHDARVTVSEALQADLIAAYCAARSSMPGFDEEAFRASLALMQAQRATKILGIFARLAARDGKPGYLRHLPRVENYVRQALGHPALEPLRPFYEVLLPQHDRTG